VLETTLSKSTAAGVSSAKPLHFFLERYAEAYKAELEAFITSLREGTEPSPNGQAGLDALRLAEAAEQAFRSGISQRL
jgi:myo-inositol 2-dehydrogenase/D-chiro-inositol 1-dehydrogenase